MHDTCVVTVLVFSMIPAGITGGHRNTVEERGGIGTGAGNHMAGIRSADIICVGYHPIGGRIIFVNISTENGEMGLKVTVAQFKRWLLRAFKTTVDLHMIQELKGGLVLGYGYIGRIIGLDRKIQESCIPRLEVDLGNLI